MNARTVRSGSILDYLPVVLSMLGDISIAFVFIVTWLEPSHPLARPLETLLLVMLLEFITIHSSAFMGNVWISPRGDLEGRVKSVIGIGVLYTLFVGGFSLGFGVWWPLGAFWLLTANRVLTMVVDPNPTPGTKQRLQSRWGAAVGAYVGFAMVTTLLPIPRFGISRVVVDAAEITGTGLWVDEPHRVVAFGFLYFAASGLLEAKRHLSRRRDSDLPSTTG